MATTRRYPRGIRKQGFKSQFELAISEDMKTRGVPCEYEREAYAFTVERRYTPDFFLPNGVIVEAKGWFKPSDRTKLLAVKKANPHLDIRILFQNAGTWCTKKRKATYGQWATKHGFPWASGRIPESWTKA